jgi:hypothetical protein
MVLTFDTSRAPLRLADFVALVRVVVAARPADESIWLEWKSSLDLGSPDGKVHLARGIVGLANRMPNVAHPYCEGRGYLVIGAAPGETQGVREVDPAVLDAWLRPYLGVDGPRWQPHWLEMDGVTVLVVEVAAPHMGDPMHMIHKEGPKVRDGSVLVRRPGSTEPATSTELQALLARMSAAGRLEGVRFALAEPAALMPIDFSQAAVEEWTEAQRQRCLRSLRAHLQAQTSGSPRDPDGSTCENAATPFVEKSFKP